jgi:hypothetical protein
MDLSEILLWIIVVAMLCGLFVKGAASKDPNMSCLAMVGAGLIFVGGGLAGITFGIGKIVGWW